MITFTYLELISLSPIIFLTGIIILLVFYIALWRNYHTSITISIFSLIITLILNINILLNISSPLKIGKLFYIDKLSIIYSTLCIIISIIICIISYESLLKNSNIYYIDEFYILLLISTIGSFTLINANHFSTIFIGSQLISIPIFGMLGYLKNQFISCSTSIKYSLLSSLSSSFLLLGISLIYSHTGELSVFNLNPNSFNNIHDKLQFLTHPILLFGLGCIIISISFKLSIIPFHTWTVDIYKTAFLPALTTLTLINKISIFIIIMRVFIYNPYIIHYKLILFIISTITIITILYSSIMTLKNRNIKEIIAYSSMSHFSYLILILTTIKNFNKILIIKTIIIYSIGYLISIIGIFIVINILFSLYDKKIISDDIYTYKNLYWYHPVLAISLTIMMLSLASIPLTFGFIGKIYIIIFSIQYSMYHITSIMTISSIINLACYINIIILIYLSPTTYINKFPQNTSITYKKFHFIIINIQKIFIILLSILIILLGIYPQLIINYVNKIF